MSEGQRSSSACARMLALEAGRHGAVGVQPRWPSKRVRIAPEVMEALQRVQARLPDGMDVLLSRGYEPPAGGLGVARFLFRAVGVLVFLICFPRRWREIPEIFSANGHDRDGTHVDVSLLLNGRRMRWLPLGVFTPLSVQRRITTPHALALATLREALCAEGFVLHRNATERLQIHCDWCPVVSCTSGG